MENNTSQIYLDEALIGRDLSLSLSLIVDIRDDERCCVLSLITDPWAEEGVDPLGEEAPGEGVDVRSVLRIEKQHGALLIICVHSNNLWLLLHVEQDGGRIQSTILVPAPQSHRPVAVLGLGRDHSFPVDGFFHHPQVPEGLCPHCNLQN